MTNADGVWVRLDADSMQHYCAEPDGEAWTLVKGPEGIIYLQHEADLLASDSADDLSRASSPFSSATSLNKGFDFTNAQQRPSFAVFGTPQGILLIVIIKNYVTVIGNEMCI